MDSQISEYARLRDELQRAMGVSMMVSEKVNTSAARLLKFLQDSGGMEATISKIVEYYGSKIAPALIGRDPVIETGTRLYACASCGLQIPKGQKFVRIGWAHHFCTFCAVVGELYLLQKVEQMTTVLEGAI